MAKEQQVLTEDLERELGMEKGALADDTCWTYTGIDSYLRSIRPASWQDPVVDSDKRGLHTSTADPAAQHVDGGAFLRFGRSHGLTSAAEPAAQQLRGGASLTDVVVEVKVATNLADAPGAHSARVDTSEPLSPFRVSGNGETDAGS